MSDDPKPVTERQEYIDQKIAEAEGVTEAADATLQERDSKEAQKVEEKKGMGEAAHDSVKAARIAMLRNKIEAVRASGNTAVLEKLQAQLNALENSE